MIEDILKRQIQSIATPTSENGRELLEECETLLKAINILEKKENSQYVTRQLTKRFVHHLYMTRKMIFFVGDPHLDMFGDDGFLTLAAVTYLKIHGFSQTFIWDNLIPIVTYLKNFVWFLRNFGETRINLPRKERY